ncbi:DoxX family protein [Corynebacterium atypicum]|uniref:DoxX family protein n=1 Tax=Corynebacterium atypicum TaxID=191610 RepID=A0ABM5QN93_9CORY|nr:DoxX family protein [Corynebacterium atypicum]AIG64211.1 DoxX family protein [Corynebacterium atypicum]
MIRKLARPMLASVYVVDGVDTLVNTEAHIESAESVINRTRSLLPRKYARKVPEDPELVARTIGGAKVAAGSLLALGKLPRLAATTLAVTAVPTLVGRYAFWETQDEQEKRERRSGFLTRLALLGGLAITSVDTEGKPGVAWRAKDGAQRANKKVQAVLPSRQETENFADQASNWFQDKAEAVQDYVEDNKDDWLDAAKEGAEKVQETAADWAGKAQDFFEDNYEDWLESARENTETAKKGVVKAAGKAQDRYQDALDTATKKAEKKANSRGAKKAKKKAEKLGKRAEKAIEKAQKKLG